MEITPYPNFWKEEPPCQRQAWRPTDQDRRKIQRFGVLQMGLLVAILCVAALITIESKQTPLIYAQLPNGLVFEASKVEAGLDVVARKGLVNDVLPLLYYQEGSDNYLSLLKNNVRMSILTDFAWKIQEAQGQTNVTVHLEIIETFETGGQAGGKRSWFEAMTKANLVRNDKHTRKEAPYYLRTHWEVEGDRCVLTGVLEATPGDYYQAFIAEKDRLHKLSPAELERELNIRQNKPIPVPERKSGKL